MASVDEKRSPVFAGLGGAALAAALVAVGGHGAARTAESPEQSAAVVQQAGEHPDITSNQEGPWYAFCQEYATTEFDHGEDPARQRGITGHRVPEEADEGTVEITKNKRTKDGLESEKFNVRKHTIGDLASCVPRGETLRVVIATVPDPNATQMRLDFDRDLVAIQRAAAAEHYLYTRYWFPWRGSDWAADKNDDSEAETRRRQEPGILCFRKNGDPLVTDRLFVLLVGETPTSGVNRIQFSHALYYAAELTGPTIPDDNGMPVPNISMSNEIDLAGPHFSASYKPIQDVLTKLEGERAAKERASQEGSLSLAGEQKQSAKRVLAPPPLQTAKFVSPEASGEEFTDGFLKFCSSHSKQALCELQALALPTGDVRSKTLEFLQSIGYEPRLVAQLSEDESAFGESQIIPRTDPSAPKPGWADYGLKLHFPRDLSSVRNLSDEQSEKIAQAGSKYFSMPSSSLPTKLTAQEPIDRDSPPAFGEEQETAEVARSLADSVAQMRIHRIRAVVITASNPLDRVYLLEYLHNQLPDLRAVTVDADTLELDRPHFVDLTGTIAVTAMPPLAGMVNTVRKAGQKDVYSMVSFASSSQEGEFLAIETLFHDETVPLPPGDDADCFYFSVVGGSGFRLISNRADAGANPRFPCRALRGGRSIELPTKTAAEEFVSVHEHTSAPRVFLTFAGAIVLWNLLHFSGVIGSWKRRESSFSYASKLAAKQEPDRQYLLFAVNNQLLIVDVLMAWLSWKSLSSVAGAERHDWTLAVLFCLISIAAAGAAALSGQIVARFLTRRKDKDADKTLVRNMFIASLYLVTSLVMIFLLPFNRSGQGIFLERITQLGDGLSPVMPITAILLGYYLWGWTQLRRMEWGASRKPYLAFSKDLNTSLHEAMDSLQNCLGGLVPDQPEVMAVCSVIAVLAAIVLYHSFNGLDGPWFSRWFTIWGALMLLLTVAMTCAHAWSIWNRLRQLLILLEATTISETFKRLADKGVLQVKIWDLAKTQRSFKVSQYTVESIGQLYGATSKEVIEAKEKLEGLEQAGVKHLQLLPNQIEEYSAALNAPMNMAIQSLSPAETMPADRRNDLQAYLALRLVALIRFAMLHIGAMICFVAYGFVLAVGSIMFYPFEGRKTISELLVITFVGLLIWVGTMMVQFQRNEMLSHLEGTKPGEANYWQVGLHLLGLGGLPLIAILTSQFPGIANFAYSFFRPLLGVLH